jgi:MarR family transcriptional regulator, temperature-dependent positive regulator of motility
LPQQAGFVEDAEQQPAVPASARVLKEYNRRLAAELVERGFRDFSPAFPQILSNLDDAGTRISTLAERAGGYMSAAGQLFAEIERCGYVKR